MDSRGSRLTSSKPGEELPLEEKLKYVETKSTHSQQLWGVQRMMS